MRNWVMRPAEETRRWQIGDVTVTKVSEMVLEGGLDEPSDTESFLGQATRARLLDIDWLRPDFITADGAIRLAIHALVIAVGDRRIVVDTCVGNDRDRPHRFWQALGLPFLDSLMNAGFDRHAIDTVVCTHLHVDHVGWNTMLVDGAWRPTFPNARYLFGRVEYQDCVARMALGTDDRPMHPDVFMADAVQPIVTAGLVDLVETDHRLCDQVRLVPTQGHTPGHVSVVIESAGARAIITGDAIHHPCQLAHPDWTLHADADPAAAVATRRRLLAARADGETLFIGTHWAGGSSGRVVRTGDAYRLL